MKLNEKIELSLITIEHAINTHPKIFASCSFGKDSIVVVDLVRKIKKDCKFIGIDTGYEFPETLDCRLLLKILFEFVALPKRMVLLSCTQHSYKPISPPGEIFLIY